MKRVLIVDDDRSVRESYSDIFELYDINVSLAEDGFRGVAQVEKSHFDLILLDIIMPGIDGLETYRRMKVLFPEVRVLGMTAFIGDSLVKELLKEGALEVLHKPFEVDEVLKYLDK